MSNYPELVCVIARRQVLALLLLAGPALAEDKDPLAVFELGAAGEWGLNNGGSSFGSTGAVEFIAIKNWLEIEAGATALFSRGQTEWDTDFIFKKPLELSPSVEFEPGIGPVWIHTIAGGTRTDAVGARLYLTS